MEEQQATLTAEPSFQPSNYLLVISVCADTYHHTPVDPRTSLCLLQFSPSTFTWASGIELRLSDLCGKNLCRLNCKGSLRIPAQGRYKIYYSFNSSILCFYFCDSVLGNQKLNILMMFSLLTAGLSSSFPPSLLFFLFLFLRCCFCCFKDIAA